VELWRVAFAEGVPIDGVPPSWLETLSQLHDRPYYLRYSEGVHGIVTPARAELQSGLKNLVEIVGRHVSPAFAADASFCPFSGFEKG
jgi:hypothetical protein